MEQTYLTIIQYDSAADQTFLVMNSEQIFGYFENAESGTNAMIAIMNTEQRTTVLSKGYSVQTVEENPDMNNYLYFENDTPNSAKDIAYLGKVYMITENHTLVQTNGNESSTASISADFKEIPIEDMRPLIAENNEVDLTALENTTTEVSPTVTPQGVGTNGILIPIIIGTIIIASVAGFLIWKKIKSNSNLS